MSTSVLAQHVLVCSTVNVMMNHPREVIQPPLSTDKQLHLNSACYLSSSKLSLISISMSGPWPTPVGFTASSALPRATPACVRDQLWYSEGSFAILGETGGKDLEMPHAGPPSLGSGAACQLRSLPRLCCSWAWAWPHLNDPVRNPDLLTSLPWPQTWLTATDFIGNPQTLACPWA